MGMRRSAIFRLALISALTAALVFLIALFLLRDYMRSYLPLWAALVSRPIIQSMQSHPHFAQFVHVLINAVPDISFALLAVAGLSYLMPEIARKLEARRGIRFILLTLFGLFGLLAIWVNAVNHTEQEQQQITQSQV
jgi:hypothetical protein